jgi:hypothetical protein
MADPHRTPIICHPESGGKVKRNILFGPITSDYLTPGLVPIMFLADKISSIVEE